MIYPIFLLLFPALVLAQDKDLEKAFWVCDYSSTNGILSFEEAALCSTVFEKIKKEKFNGDFSAFLAWWKANKDIEHSILNKKKT